ncbi:uridine kinase [Bacillus sp. KH172YL63]|nr:kinase [Bacillus sp. KH172YL63]BCB02526.1 uridine kinase [Bacillus sp. KH172YL63]
MNTDFDLVHFISSHQLHSRFILGIDGLSRSGKTTLVNELKTALTKEALPFRIFHIDDHIVERARRYGTGHEEWYEYYQLQWDTEWLRGNFFDGLKDRDELHLPYYNSESDTQQFKRITLPKKCVVIVEGVFLQRKEWKEYFDTIIYLDCPREKRYARESESTQQNLWKFENRYWKAEDHYVKTCDPIGRADFVIHY